MKEKSTVSPPKPENKEKAGFFKRIINKMDTVMKEKADEKSKQGSCCGSDKGDGKCC